MASEDLCKGCRGYVHQLTTAEKFKLIVCFDYDLLEPRSAKHKKQEKKLKLEELIRKVSALRNSNGGVLFVHMRGISYANRSMGLFNEYVDPHLNDLIEDGSPFVTEYSKRWFGDHPKDIRFDVLVLTVTGSSSVSTADFKTKVTLDNSIKRPTSQNMDKYIFEIKPEGPAPASPLWPNVREEGRNTQFKSIPSGSMTGMSLSQIIDTIWSKLRLPEYITSFSKLQTGGSFYIGVSEVGHEGQNGIQKDGIPFPRELHQNFCSSIHERIRKEIVCFSPQERRLFRLNDAEVKIQFQHCDGGNFVIEIAVAPIHGCVFYDTHGPETYVMDGRTAMERMTFAEWLEAFEKRRLCTDCQASLCGRCRNNFTYVRT